MASYISNNEPNFHIVGIFDVKQIIQDIDDAEFKDAQIMTCEFPERLCRKLRHVDIAVITVPVSKSSVGGRHCG